MRAKLTITIDYDTAAFTLEDARQTIYDQLWDLPQYLAGEGFFSSETELLVDEWSSTLEIDGIEVATKRDEL